MPETKIAPPEKKGSTLTIRSLLPVREVPYKNYFIEEYPHYTVVFLAPPSTVNIKKPKRIVACDLDDTLVNANQSFAKQSPVLLGPETKKIAELANSDEDSLYACITARPCPLKAPDQLSSDTPLSALSLLSAVPTKKFSLIIFTDKHSKAYALDYLFKKFGLPSKASVCLIDDARHNLVDCIKSGYVAIPVTSGPNSLHPEFLRDFLKGTLTSNKSYESTLKLLSSDLEAKPSSAVSAPTVPAPAVSAPAVSAPAITSPAASTEDSLNLSEEENYLYFSDNLLIDFDPPPSRGIGSFMCL